MRILYEKDLKTSCFKDTSVALGSFEALHKGHIKIINNTVLCAKKNHTESIVTIFKNPILKNRKYVCETLEERLNILEKLNVDNVVIFEFNEKFSSICYSDFFYDILKNTLSAKYIFTGFNYHFGHKAIGDTEILSKLCKDNNIEINVIPAVKNKVVISSTHIYNLIKSGDLEEIKTCLSRPYSIRGTVVSGRKIGRKIGFPTANIDLPNDKALLPKGVYFTKCCFDEKNFFSIVNVGFQPTVTTDQTLKIEAYIFDFEGDIYNRTITLKFLEKIRDTITFENLDKLQEQLKKDRETAEKLSIKYKK